MILSPKTKEFILLCVRIAAENQAYGGSDLADFEQIVSEALDLACQNTVGWKMVLNRGNFSERAIELFFNAEGYLTLRILPKNKDQWECCIFTKDEAIEFIQAFFQMLGAWGDEK